MFYQSADEIRQRSRRQALLYVALAAVAFVSSALQYYGQSQVRTYLRLSVRCVLGSTVGSAHIILLIVIDRWQSACP
jgi:hypothetical protein